MMFPATVGGAVTALTQYLKDAGIDSARHDARLLVAAATGLRPQDILLSPDHPMTAPAQASLSDYAMRRLRREPVSRILGMRGFWTLDLEVGPSTLDPRPDTETLVETVLEVCTHPPRRILDLGTGTGAILLALLSEYPDATGVGTDLMPEAVALATRNAGRCGLSARAEFQQGSWTDGVTGCFDVIVSNPPYIPADDIAALAPEVREYDPLTALVGGGEDGLDCYRTLVPLAAERLEAGGLLALEVGVGQAGAVATLLEETGFIDVGQRADLGSIDRCVYGIWGRQCCNDSNPCKKK